MEPIAPIVLRGMTWNHDRGIKPVLAASERFSKANPSVYIDWDNRPLQDFESQPIRELAQTYDLMIIDHPHLGEAVHEGLLVDFTKCGRDEELTHLAAESAGPSHASYSFLGGQWSLAVDAATPVASYRPDRLTDPVEHWSDVLDLARKGQVVMPLRAPHVLMVFFWLARNRGLKIAESAEVFMDSWHAVTVLEQMAELVSQMDDSCLQMDPIDLYELMSTQNDAPAYCPHGYGYINYSFDGFRPHRLQFTDIADAAGGGVGGTVLGGTGISVSALGDHRALAVDYAFKIAGADFQTQWWVQSGGQPGHAAAWEDKASNSLCHNFLIDTRKTLNAAWIRPRYNGYLTFQDEASHEITRFLKGDCGSEACVASLQTLYRSTQL